MMLDGRNDVSIAQIVIYVPILFVSIALIFRDGFTRSGGWIGVNIFALIRIIGSSMELATIAKPDVVGLNVGSAILSAVGLSPLLLAALGLLRRLAASSRGPGKAHWTDTIHVHAIQLLVIVGLALALVGGFHSGSDYEHTGTYSPQTISKVATVLFIVSLLAIGVVTHLTSRKLFAMGSNSDKPLMLAVIASLPFLLVRLVYSILTNFVNKPQYNTLDGSVTVWVCVSVIEEMITCLIYETAGFMARGERSD
ncbi:MAG: Phosphotransferase enzyme, partial [Chaenotheca gracillima]